MLTPKTKVYLVVVMMRHPELVEPIVNFLLTTPDYCAECKFIVWLSNHTDLLVDWDYYLYPGCP